MIKELEVAPTDNIVQDKVIAQKNVAVEPRVQNKKSAPRYATPNRQRHSLVQNKEHLLRQLCPTKSRLNQLERKTGKTKSGFQAQSMQQLENDRETIGYVMCIILKQDINNHYIIYYRRRIL